MEVRSGIKTASGYLALPRSGKGVGVLVLHAWWGLNGFFETLCDRLAQQGFVAFAPDLYAGAVTSSIEEAEQLVSKVDLETTQTRALQALNTLRSHPAVQGERVGVVGCSFGAAWALLLSTLRPNEVAAVVTFYGLYAVDFTTSRAAYLGHFAEHDDWEPLDQARQMEADIRAAGREVHFYVYPGIGHWFFEEDRPDAYHAESARLAWERTLSFLRSYLYPKVVI
ncbi:MAG TPA: dienelactone hydrolase family protein [Chthonomonadaceae bacterium]|nr:dienelactone hydrolase family protein [Chthonomonadaceae bacterium]